MKTLWKIGGRTLAIYGVVTLCVGFQAPSQAAMGFIDAQIAAHAGESGVYVLERGDEALLARAWLADNAQKSIAVQYFIWSTDNIGVLASEALLRAAERGVRVRVIVDDLLVDAPDESLLALAQHPNIEIRIYNPKHSVGTSLYKRLVNVLTDFRGVNQRMHDKTFIVDGKVAITGGRNMADEYFDYDQIYNFRDRDALLLGPVVGAMQTSFERFWASELSVEVERLYGEDRRIKASEVARIYVALHEYARAPDNFAPEVRAALNDIARAFPRIAAQLVWGRVDFISDMPGKNESRSVRRGGGLSTEALSRLVADARHRITIQSPYLVLSEEAQTILRDARARGVAIRINTNSLAATDNLAAFGGYHRQRRDILGMGIEVFEYRPDSERQRQEMRHRTVAQGRTPAFALHAKTLVIDSKILYIGTFNLDPRSQNLNTEVGIVVHDSKLASDVEQTIEVDLLSANSWNARNDPDQFAPLNKRLRAWFWRAVPITPLL